MEKYFIAIPTLAIWTNFFFWYLSLIFPCHFLPLTQDGINFRPSFMLPETSNSQEPGWQPD